VAGRGRDLGGEAAATSPRDTAASDAANGGAAAGDATAGGATALWLPIRRALGRVRRAFVFDTFDVFRRPVTEGDREFRDPDGYHFSWAAQSDVARCQEYHTQLDERERREGAARLAMEHKCVIATVVATPPAERGADGEPLIVFSMWMNPRNINIPGHVKRRLHPHQSFIYKAFTSPRHRGRKLYELGMRFVLASLAREGKRELLGYAHVNKSVSRKGLAALQFDSLGRFHRVGVGPICTTFVSAQLRGLLPQGLRSSGLPADRLLERTQQK
jgi:hypothetical protein